MRNYGVPNYPDPDSSGQLPKTSAQQLGVSNSRFASAQQACQRLLPNAGSSLQQQLECIRAGDCPPALVQQILSAQRNYARCMRSHGVPNFPDPTLDSQGQPVFDTTRAGISHELIHSPQYRSAELECNRLAPAPESRE